MLKMLQFLTAALAAVVLSSCAGTNPASRVAQYPAMMETLSPEHRTMVLQGRVEEGMTRDAVYLAWGRADNITRGSEGGRQQEIWRYTTLRAIHHTTIGFGLGFGYGGFGRRGRYGRNGCYGGWYGDPFMETGPEYVPVTSAVVRFRNGRVTAWESAR